MQPPPHLDGTARLKWYQERRALEGERERVERIRAKRERGEALSTSDEAVYAYSPFGSAAGCRCKGS